MKLLPAVLVVLFCILPFLLRGQHSAVLQSRFSPAQKRATVADFLSDINSRSGYRVEYAIDHIDGNRVIQLRKRTYTLGGLLFLILEGQQVSIVERNGKIILTPAAARLPIIVESGNQYVIFGIVREAGSGEPLIGATVRDAVTQRGTVTNNSGYYSLQLPEGMHRIDVSYIGYTSNAPVVELKADTRADVHMAKRTDLPEVIVSATPTRLQGMGSKNDTVRQAYYDNVMGEQDVLRSLYLLPGVKMAPSLSGGMLVRGGGPDQNLFMLDGIPIFNPTHMLGALSVVNSATVKGAAFYKSDFPSRFGGGASSVMDVYSKDGNMEHWRGQANLSTVASSLTLEGPIKKDRTALLLSFRKSLFDPVTRLLNQDTRIKFYDAQLKVTHWINPNNKLALNLYTSRDKLSYTFDDGSLNTRQRWGNAAGSFSWFSMLKSKSFITTSVFFSSYYNATGYKLNMPADSTGKQKEHSSINTLSSIYFFSIKSQLEQYINDQLKFNVGMRLSYTSINPFESLVSDVLQDLDPGDFRKTDQLPYGEGTLYLEAEVKPSPRWLFRPGLHFSSYRYKTFRYKVMQPRFYLQYNISPEHQLYGSFNKVVQYLHLVTNPFMDVNTDLWVPSTAQLAPEENLMVNLGYSFRSKKKFSLTFEIYKKYLKNVTNYVEGRSVFYNANNWERNVQSGYGGSQGLEIAAIKDFGPVQLTGAYTLSYSWRKFADINDGKRFPFKYDRRHDLNLTATVRFDKTKSATLLWNIASGDMYSLPQYLVPDFDNTQGILNPNLGFNNYKFTYHYASVNQFRTSPYQRLDLSGQYKPKSKKKWQWTFTAGVYNVSGAPSQYLYSLTSDESGTSRLDVIKNKLLDITPYISASLAF
ncbi:TonB-dependent receptor [Chitinophaga pendula]|uniref:TonB-dependent receptor n=1 Tax=Chitinophaga TaxID=79328 RepID=UPI000BAE906B|nr:MULTISPECIES: TonB-dependent receptor [Chitinophaga]ASZ12756.1 hypothetical protein CK934_18240 [Chitinophaga sp. MD30]UCJ09624.1 TonB-dependent receptor [Chitinophaga pendula]